MKTLYKATSIAKGARKGHVKTEDGPIDLNLSVPKSMGGSAIEAIAEKKKIDVNTEEISVTATIGIGTTEKGNLQLDATLDCYIPGVDVKTGEDLVNKAHEICPFSRATRDNITVNLNLMLDE